MTVFTPEVGSMLRVEWVDSVILSDAWMDADDVPTKTAHLWHRQETLGYVVHQSDETLVLAMSRNTERSRVQGVIAIPLRSISLVALLDAGGRVEPPKP